MTRRRAGKIYNVVRFWRNVKKTIAELDAEKPDATVEDLCERMGITRRTLDRMRRQPKWNKDQIDRAIAKVDKDVYRHRLHKYGFSAAAKKEHWWKETEQVRRSLLDLRRRLREIGRDFGYKLKSA